MGRDNRRDNYEDSERTSGDWRSGPRDEVQPPDGDSFRSRYDNRDRRDDRECITMNFYIYISDLSIEKQW